MYSRVFDGVVDDRMPVSLCGALRIAIAFSGTFWLPFVMVGPLGSTASELAAALASVRYWAAMWSAICLVMLVDAAALAASTSTTPGSRWRAGWIDERDQADERRP